MASRLLGTVPLGVLASPPDARGAIRFERNRFWDDPAERGGIDVAGNQPLSFLHTPGRSFRAWWTAAPAQLLRARG